MAWVSAAVAVGSMAVSAAGASANNKAAAKSLKAQATADTAARKATASSMIASIHSQNQKTNDLRRSVEIMNMQGKADALMRTENYNDTMATAMVMGAASGRMLNEGSTATIFSKSKSDYNWDQLWSKNQKEISEAAVYQDMQEVYQAGSTSLLLGQEQLEVARLGSMAGQQNTAAAAQQSFNNSLTNMAQSYASSYGGTLFGYTPWKDS